MEVFRHSRRRSRYHSLNKSELLRKKESLRSVQTRQSRKFRIYDDIDEAWERESNQVSFDTLDEEQTQTKQVHRNPHEVEPEEE